MLKTVCGLCNHDLFDLSATGIDGFFKVWVFWELPILISYFKHSAHEEILDKQVTNTSSLTYKYLWDSWWAYLKIGKNRLSQKVEYCKNKFSGFRWISLQTNVIFGYFWQFHNRMLIMDLKPSTVSWFVPRNHFFIRVFLSMLCYKYQSNRDKTTLQISSVMSWEYRLFSDWKGCIVRTTLSLRRN